MTSSDIRKKFIEFYKARGHREIASAPLVPENDPTTLFTSSGMQPLVPYLLGESHPLGKRLVDSQKCFRSQDIDEVGDNRHMTFFEMLGNWSLGDYFKKEQLPWVFEFFTKGLGLDPKRLYVSVFEGNVSVPKDEESVELWKELFLKEGIHPEVVESRSAKASRDGRIFLYDAHKNWWSRSGEPDKMPPGEPGGPDSEVFYDFGEELGLHEKSPYKDQPCHPNCDCGRFMEIGNSVFMQYQKLADGSLKELPNKNVDFGGGLERLNAAANNQPDIFLTDSFSSVIRIIELLSKKKYGEDEEVTKAMRIIADHMKAVTMMLVDGVYISNKTQGYVARRLLRRAIIKLNFLVKNPSIEDILSVNNEVLKMYDSLYLNYKKDKEIILEQIKNEILKFTKSLSDGKSQMEKGIHELEEYIKKNQNQFQKDEFMWIPNARTIAEKLFDLYQTWGLPIDYSLERLKQSEVFRLSFEWDQQDIIIEQFEKLREEHAQKSRLAAGGMFKGGLAEHNTETTKLHTATHLLHQALRMVLGTHVSQKGSNITGERLRFDFSHPQKLTDEELKKVEDIVNEEINKNLPVTMEEMDKDKALASGALGFFVEKYGDRVKVYTVGDPKGIYFSREICGGPHVSFTGELGHFTITKEESAASGVRRIYATVT